MINKRSVTLLVPERLVYDADGEAMSRGWSRAFVMTRWMLEGAQFGMDSEEVLEYFPKGLGDKKNSVISVTSGEGAEYGNISPELVTLHGEMAKNAVGLIGRTLTKEQVDSPGFGLPGPGFDGGVDFRGLSGEPINTESFRPSPQMRQDIASGADPRILNQAEKPHARTLGGVTRMVKSKKIAKVPAPVQNTVAPDPVSGHDPKSCKVYACLMCQAAKGDAPKESK